MHLCSADPRVKKDVENANLKIGDSGPLIKDLLGARSRESAEPI